MIAIYFYFKEIIGAFEKRTLNDLPAYKAIILGSIINIIPDYISLYQTRCILNKFRKTSNFTNQIFAVILDLIISCLIIWASINIFNIFTNKKYISSIEMIAVFSEYSVFFYSTFLTSIWLWGYFISTGIMRISYRTFIYKTLDIEKRPVQQLALISSTLVFLFVFVLPLALQSKNVNDISNFDQLICEMSPKDACPHVARIAKDTRISEIYLLKACKGGASKYCISESTMDEKNNDIKLFWPVNGQIISKFGRHEEGGRNDGINIAAPEGTNIIASADGTVIYSGDKLKEFGNLILIQHSKSFVTAYAHNKINLVTKYQKVQQGEIIAHVGTTGLPNSPQLHFEVRIKGKPFDPIKYLKKL